jgi:aminoglycoside 2'-N-acetyltransferase I
MLRMRILSFPEHDVPPELRIEQVRLQDQAWPSDEPSGPEPWHDQALRPVSMLLMDGDRVVAALDILSKEIVVGLERFAASGLSAVVTDPLERGKGYGRTLCEAAKGVMAEAGADVGIFTCDGGLTTFYERAGWRHLEGTVVIGGTPEDPYPSDALDKVTMGAFFSERARAHEASFIGRRIDLFPGTIDRLW